MKTTVTKLATVALVTIATSSFAQNIAINSTGAAPSNKAILDLSATNKGLLVPRIELNSSIDPITGGKPEGLLVYNDGGSVGSNGFYYWTGSAWTPFVGETLPSGTSGQTLRHDGTSWVADSEIYNDGTEIGIGTSTPDAKLNVYEPDESSALTNFTQGTGRAGILITSEYYGNSYTPGVFWNTSNNNASKPKAGIFLKEDAIGTTLKFGTSNSYGTGITNEGMNLDENGNLGIGTTNPSAQLHTTGSVKHTGLAGNGNILLKADNNGTLSYTSLSGSTGDMMLGDGSFASISGTLSANAVTNQTSSNQSAGFRISGNGLFNGGKVGIGTTNPTYGLDVAGTAGFDEYLYHNNDNNTYMRFTDDLVIFHSGGKEMMRLWEGSTDKVVINEDANGVSFEVEGNSDDDLFYVNSGSNRVGVGTDSPDAKFEVNGDVKITDLAGSGTRMVVTNSSGELSTQSIPSGGSSVWSENGNKIYYNSDKVGIGTSNPTYDLDVAGDAGFSQYLYHNDDANTYFQFESDEIRFYAGGRKFITLDEGSNDIITINDDQANVDFRVEGDGDGNLLYVNAGSNNVGISTDNPSAKLEVDGDVRITDLSGSGTRMVVADANGDLSTQAIPSGGGGSGSGWGNGSTLTLYLTHDEASLDVDGVSIISVSTDDEDNEIRGLKNGVAGQMISIINTDGSDKVKFKKNVGSQKFREDLEVDDKQGAIIMYDGSKWYVLSKH